MARHAEQGAGVAGVDLDGQTALVTGSTDGVGQETALALGRLGARVLVHGRDAEKGAAVVSALEETGADAAFFRADFADFRAVRDLADAVNDRVGELDVLVNNAGAYFRTGRVTDHSIERTIAVNHLAPFLLTNRLRPVMAETGRIVTVSSAVHRREDLDLDRGVDAFRTVADYDGLAAYSRSKLANILFTRELSRRLSGPTANCLHPGFVPGSALWREAPLPVRVAVDIADRLPRVVSRWFAETPTTAAETPVFLAVAPEAVDVTGAYYVDCNRATPSRTARDDALAERLWEVSARLVDLPEPSGDSSPIGS